MGPYVLSFPLQNTCKIQNTKYISTRVAVIDPRLPAGRQHSHVRGRRSGTGQGGVINKPITRPGVIKAWREGVPLALSAVSTPATVREVLV